jgi:two-component system chemotaxis response regulator CheY
MRRSIVDTLNRAGYEDVTEASDGMDALAKMKVGQFNFVIADWNMPEMDGLTFVSQMRSSDDFRDVPILMITTRLV